jgi:uncharacterized protein (DUF2235 family)
MAGRAAGPRRVDDDTIDQAKQVKKRLFIFCDGTWQDGVNKTRPLTNVATLARCLKGIANDGYLQIVYYDNGVGNGTGWPSHLIDGATGRGEYLFPYSLSLCLFDG